MLLRAIPIDIVERIVILTDTNRDYKNICRIVERLKDSQRKERIIESITKQVVDDSGYVYYYLDNKLHREYDKPAVESVKYRMKKWYYNNNLHRENDKPAYECEDGTKSWFYNGKRHRENDKPAMECGSGTKEWYYNGKRHRENGKPAVEKANGTKEWYYKGQLHRENGEPAIEYMNGMKEWWVKGRKIKVSWRC